MPAKTTPALTPSAASKDLQDLIADITAAIVERKTFGRAELEVMRRKLTATVSQLRDDERAGVTARMVLTDLVGGIDRQVVDLAGLAGRARRMAGLSTEQVPG